MGMSLCTCRCLGRLHLCGSLLANSDFDEIVPAFGSEGKAPPHLSVDYSVSAAV